MGQCWTSEKTVEPAHDHSHHGKRQATRHFRFLKQLGTGSYGSVFLVERITDGRQYALKQTVLTELEEPLRWVAVNEIRLMASLEPHPHVVTLFEGFLDGSTLCLVMELMPNGELANIIEKHAEKETLIPEADIWHYFIQVALGLKYLHAHGILHRDLKPQNILISAEGVLKLADLGVAHVVRGKGTTKVQIGTPHYMAPEVWRRDPYSFPADIWALGCILHEMCTRKPLFLAPTEQEVESRVIAGVVPAIPRRYSPDLQNLINAMLEYSAADRPTINDILDSKAVQARLSSLAEASWASMSISIDINRAASSVLDPIEIPADLSLLNLRLPPSRYSMGEGLITELAAESRAYRDFTLGPAELPIFVMPRATSPRPSMADTAYDSNGTGAVAGGEAAEGEEAGGPPHGPSLLPPPPPSPEGGGLEGGGPCNPVGTSGNWSGQANMVVPQRPPHRLLVK